MGSLGMDAYLVECEMAYRHAVVYPAAERRAQQERELRALRHGRTRRGLRYALGMYLGVARPRSRPVAHA